MPIRYFGYLWMVFMTSFCSAYIVPMEPSNDYWSITITFQNVYGLKMNEEMFRGAVNIETIKKQLKFTELVFLLDDVILPDERQIGDYVENHSTCPNARYYASREMTIIVGPLDQIQKMQRERAAARQTIMKAPQRSFSPSSRTLTVEQTGCMAALRWLFGCGS